MMNTTRWPVGELRLLICWNGWKCTRMIMMHGSVGKQFVYIRGNCTGFNIQHPIILESIYLQCGARWFSSASIICKNNALQRLPRLRSPVLAEQRVIPSLGLSRGLGRIYYRLM